MSLERYSFCFLRYVHEPLSGEFANVGVLLWAWKNGVWNVYQPLSFDLKQGETIRNKAYRWESLTRFLADSPERPKIHLLLGEPSGDQRKDYAKAKDVLRSSRVVELVEENEASDFARELEASVRAAS